MPSKVCLPGLPIAASADEIASLLVSHQVIVVAGATGSGKTTQLPKICLAAGRRRIVHTQPRRIAARSVAERLAQELGEPLGASVGFQVRFTKETSRKTKVKVVTDGILLAELAKDRELWAYDTIIIDEAHERSLNIDFLLGYLKQLLPKRPELKVIVTSATIDTARFAAHFDDAPVVEIPGRSYPVEIRYRPVLDGEDPLAALQTAVEELWTSLDGDILVFFSGEREIREAAEVLAGLQLPRTEIVPLYARLSLAEQRKVFASHAGTRIVLATNVAETSITVPGIRSVIDFGTARISRYSTRAKVQRLPVEPISRASADQRAGRCGRLGPGICLRLYSEADYQMRPEFTEPEILRTNLAAIILQMAWARLGEIESFPFVEPPDRANIRDGYRLLRELGALTAAGKLTKTGRLLARMPIDPVLGRMLVEGHRRGCLREVQAIVAGLAIMEVRERPVGEEAAADAAHRRFWAPLDNDSTGDDLTALLRLWRYLRDSRRELSATAFRRMCQKEYLNYLRAREWQELNGQLKEIGKELGLRRNVTPGSVAEIRTAVLSGLLSHVGALDERTLARGRGRRRPLPEYLGARGIRFAIQPGSALAATPPGLVMAVELVETSRLWGRGCAAITPEQIETVGEHLLKRQYYDPHWSEKGGQAVAREKVMLLGVPIVAERLVSLARVDAPLARELFIRSALVEGRWRTRHEFWARNQREIEQIEELATRARRDLLVGEEEIFAFYESRIPSEIVSVAHFDKWWRGHRRVDEHYLDLSAAELLADAGESLADEDYPKIWTVGGHELPVSYQFDPGAAADGVSVEVPLTAITQLSAAALTWQVPGLRLELATELIKALPKEWRVRLVPAPQAAAEALAWLAKQDIDPLTTPFWLALGRALAELRGVQVPPEAWEIERVPGHLRLTITSGGTESVSVTELAAQLRPAVADELRRTHQDYLHPAAQTWVFGEIPVQTAEDPVAFPALVDHGAGVGVGVFATADLAARNHTAGIRRLLALTSVDATSWVVSQLTNVEKFALGSSPYSATSKLLAESRISAISAAISRVRAKPVKIRSEVGFANLRENIRPLLADQQLATVRTLARVLTAWAAARQAITRLGGVPLAVELTVQVDNLIFPGFVAATPPSRLSDLARYLDGVSVRVAGFEEQPQRDARFAAEIAECEEEYDSLCELFPVGELPDEVAEIGWFLEELRISLFAQRLGAKGRVSVPRLRKLLAAAAAKD